jgi:hypothetical protein
MSAGDAACRTGLLVALRPEESERYTIASWFA